MTEELPLLTEKGLEKIRQVENSFRSPVAISLVRAHERRLGRQTRGTMHIMTDIARLVDIGPKGSNTFTYTPKGKKAIYDGNGNLTDTNRQCTTYAKLARNLLENSGVYHEVDEVNTEGKWWRLEPHSGLIMHQSKGKTTFEQLQKQHGLRVRKQKIPVTRYRDKLYEDFANHMKTVTTGVKEFLLVSGENILTWYKTENYWKEEGHDKEQAERAGGSLWSSCMNDMENKVLRIYTDCPDCQLLVGLRDGKAIGRALVWRTTTGIYMDRVYYQQDHYAGAFAAYAMEHGWMYRKHNDASSCTDIMVETNGVYALQRGAILRVDGIVKPRNVPYCDTFKYLCDGFLTNDKAADWKHQLESTNGDYMQSSEEDDHTLDTEEPITCNVIGHAYPRSKMRYTPIGYVHQDHCIIDYDGMWIVANTSVQLVDGSYADSEDEMIVEIYDGRKALKDECEFLASMNAWFPMSELTWSETEKGWVTYERISA